MKKTETKLSALAVIKLEGPKMYSLTLHSKRTRQSRR